MKILVNEMPDYKHDCLYGYENENKAVICFFRQLTAADADKASSYCPGVNKCPYLKVYEKPEPVREYPSYFTPCC